MGAFLLAGCTRRRVHSAPAETLRRVHSEGPRVYTSSRFRRKPLYTPNVHGVVYIRALGARLPAEAVLTHPASCSFSATLKRYASQVNKRAVA